jgi:hypothetical protein
MQPSDPFLWERVAAFAYAVISHWVAWLGLILMAEPTVKAYLPIASKQWLDLRLRRPQWRERAFRIIGALALAASAFQAWDDQFSARLKSERELAAALPTAQQDKINELQREVKELASPYWEMLTPVELQNLSNKQKLISHQRITINCHIAQCRELFQSLTAAFEIAGWNVTRENEAALDSLGSGIVVLPGNEISQEVRKTLEATTSYALKLAWETRN